MRGPWKSIIYLVYFTYCVSSIQDVEEIENKNNVEALSLCEMCDCAKIKRDLETKLQIYCSIDYAIDLQNIEWPNNNEGLSLDVVFEDIPWTSIEKIPANEKITSLRFINNGIRKIWSSAFSDLPNLRYLEISRNQLNSITPDIFKNLNNLVELDLSYNKLSDFNSLDFVELKSLKSINLKNNQFAKIPVDALQCLESLEQINLSENQLYFLNLGNSLGEFTWLQKLKYLDLSSNKLSSIYFKDTFEKAESLQYLNLSSNAIVTMEINVFQDCTSLKALDLSNNALSDLPELYPSVEVLQLQLNTFKKWPNLPNNIKLLDLSRNSLYENYDENYLSFDELEFLNISGNALSEFNINRPLQNLKYLDLSYNIINDVPPSMSVSKLPKLEELYLDGNPMEKFGFSSDIELRKLSAKNMNNLVSLDASGFSKLKPKYTTKLLDENGEEKPLCLDLIISHCDNLEIINEYSFQGLKLCHLDISHNKLSKLDENVAEWFNISGGVNVQGNPWDCTCDLQWVLDILLNDLYLNHPTYLHELRCASPRPLQGIRIVHWYNKNEKAFCVQSKYLSNYVILQSTNNDESDVNVLMSGGSTVVAILVAIIVALLLCIGLIVYLVRGKYKHSRAVRRQMMKKRQTLSDAKILNRTSVKQNEPINNV